MSIINRFKANFSQIEETLKRKSIVVMLGGFGEEKQASLETGDAVCQTLLNNGFKVVKIDPSKQNITEVLNKTTDVVFNCLHGQFGESGHL